MTKIIQELYFFHHFKCSKSKEVKNILDEKKITYHLIDYMNTMIDQEILKKTIETLDNKVNEIIRTKEDFFKKLKIDKKKLNNKTIFNLLITHPKILQRPIIVKKENDKIVRSLICRPPELIYKFLS